MTSRGCHICPFCSHGARPKESKYLSGDSLLAFKGGGIYRVPDMILHYIVDHGYCPPEEFIRDVTECEQILDRAEVRGIVPKRVGWLEGDFPKGNMPEGFLEKLRRVLDIAYLTMRDQYRSADL